MDSATNTRVEDVMSTPLETIGPDATARDAAKRLQEDDVGALVVRTASRGIVTNTDIRDVVADGGDPSALTVADVMTESVETITADLALVEAAAMMTNFRIEHLPVVDIDGDYVGMISTTDIANSLA